MNWPWNKKTDQDVEIPKVQIKESRITINLTGRQSVYFSTVEYDGDDPQEPWQNIITWYKDEDSNTFDQEYSSGKKDNHGIRTIIRSSIISIHCDITYK